MSELLFLEVEFEEYKTETYKGISIHNMKQNVLLKLNAGNFIEDYQNIKKLIRTLKWNVAETSSLSHFFSDMTKEQFTTEVQEYLMNSGQNELLFSIIDEGFDDYKDSVQDGEEIANTEDVIELHNTVFEEFPDIYADILINWFRSNHRELNQ